MTFPPTGLFGEGGSQSEDQGQKVVNVDIVWVCLTQGTCILNLNNVPCKDLQSLAKSKFIDTGKYMYKWTYLKQYVPEPFNLGHKNVCK